ncbi:diguanylate cyclase domain-containing protein [Roseibium aggregatum]|uniref:diguanylate cyclase n=1 Tax=Roseibium aggregatum TaxID=187304 RepID=A0A926NVH7_9HYPH|nr:diguanylate cyclase [Roseibium aggregatum]MBD1544875.1 diguanylate cyclase [Roseibium aggregatum]
MAIDSLNLEDLRAAAAEIDRCAYNHEQWFDALIGTLICGLPPDKRDLCEDAHHRCRLGQWYFSGNEVTTALSKRPGFRELGMEHERMHTHTRKMLRAFADGEDIPHREYQAFISALKNLRMEIATLRQDIDDSLYAIDPLTGVPGRAHMLPRLREYQALVERGVQTCCLAMMDLDDFKVINDRFGHPAGDQVLVSFARHIGQNLRPYDAVFRYGGEEFLIILPDTTDSDGLAVIDRLCDALAQVPHLVGADDPVYVTASFGLAGLQVGIPVERSIDRADKALYAAKAAGKNCSVLWENSMNNDA